VRTVLVANRGEIAVRVLHTLRSMGLRGVAIFSDADAGAPHVLAADEAVRLGSGVPASYLDVAAVVAAAQAAGADAVHPGYGFLSEDPAFARACVDAGLVFIGPPPDAMAAMGDKIAAKQAVEKAGVPVVPGVHGEDLDDAALTEAAGDVGFPLLVKAAAGGGGKGMRVVRDPSGLPAALVSARREASAAFGSDALLLERFVERPRHIEAQILADTHGNVMALGERECSLQRRHQKIIEECPSPWVDAGTRERLSEAAVAAARACGYVGAGTVEFLVDPAEGAFYFLEMNTRLQVEHPVTEEVYGVDLVAWQVRIAAGEQLCLDRRPTGHAVEARVYAEDPARGFVPTGGTVEALVWPEGAVSGYAGRTGGAPDGGLVRVDSGIAPGTVVGTDYDPLLAKVIAWGPDRASALRVLRAALGEVAVLGVGTNVAFMRALLADDAVVDGALDTGLVDRRVDELARVEVDEHAFVAAALARMLDIEAVGAASSSRFDVVDGWRVGEPAEERWRIRVAGATREVAVQGRPCDARVRVDGSRRHPATARWEGPTLAVTVAGRTRRYVRHGEWFGADGRAWQAQVGDELAAARSGEQAAGAGPVVSPMPGTVIAVEVAPGDHVEPGQTLVVVEAMKMEQPVTAPIAGVVARLAVDVGSRVGMEEVLAVVEGADEVGSGEVGAGGA
jgi:acetyl-CoA/propionyl-CoA carboxylase, biotin carboxylase, biotin carboxyl carrier protein